MNKKIIIPPLDLKRQYKTIKREVLRETRNVCDEQAFILGKHVSDFEEHVAAFCGTRYALGCASGTDAILLSLAVANVGPGDEVLVPAFTFIASVEPIVYRGATPVFCDIDGATYNMAASDVARKITKRTKAIIVVHLYGQTADMKPLLALARKHKLVVIEDACQAIGAVYGRLNRKTGALGDFGCFSFFPSKNLGGFGDGGLIAANKKKYIEKLRILRDHGSRRRYYHDVIGYNSRLDALQAVVLDVKLKYLPSWLSARKKKADTYARLLKTMNTEVTIPTVEHDNVHTYHQYVIRIKGVSGKKRDALLAYLRDKGVGASVYYPIPCHLQKCFAYLGYRRGDLPVCERMAASVIALPIYPELTDPEQKYIVQTIHSFLSRHHHNKRT